MILLAVAVTAFAVFLGITVFAANQEHGGKISKCVTPTISIVIASVALVAGIWLLVLLV